MSLYEEIGLYKPFIHKGHETLLNIVVTSTLLVKEAHKILRPAGLTEAQFNILLMLKGQTENGRLNQTELGKMLLVNRSNVTGLIDRMEKNELVKRFPDNEDRRVNLIQITGKGEDALKNAQKLYYKRIEELTSVLSENEDCNLRIILEKIRSGLG